MKGFLRMFGSSDANRPGGWPTDRGFFEPLGRRSSTGKVVSLQKALTVPVVLDCLTVISQTIASLPYGVFELRPNGDKIRRDNHPLMAVLASPDGESTASEFISQLVFDLISEGNSVHGIESGRIGPISRIPRYQPHGTTVERLPDGSRRWTVTDNTGATRVLVEGEVLHIRDTPLIDNLVGSSRIWHGREAIAALLSLQEYGARHFENDATPPVFIKVPTNFANPESRQNFLEAITEWFGNRRRKPAVLEYGAEVQQVATTPEASQYLETRKELQAEIARLWRMPPHKVGLMDSATFSNIEHQALEFVTDTIGPWIDRIETAINRSLILNPQRFFFEFNVAGLLRGDIKARFAAYAQARQWGWLSVNEIRRMENMNPIGPRGDQYLQPLNMTPTGSEAPERSASLFGPDERVVSQMIGGEWRPAHAA